MGIVERVQLEELLYQSLETERGGVQNYETAVRCTQNDDLREFGEYLEQTRNHETIMPRILDVFGLDVDVVVEAESKDHMNWELIGELAGEEAKTLKEAHGEVGEEEDEHLYHTTGWARELWLESLGLPAVLPPPEERRRTKSAIGADRARLARTEMT